MDDTKNFDSILQYINHSKHNMFLNLFSLDTVKIICLPYPRHSFFVKLGKIKIIKIYNYDSFYPLNKFVA